MNDLSILLERVWLTHWALALPVLIALGICVLVRARSATRAGVATVLAASTLLPWGIPVLADPGTALHAARVDFALTPVSAEPSPALSVFELCWLTGIVLATVWVAVGLFRARRRLRSMVPAGAGIRASVLRLARELDVGMPRVLLWDAPCSPAVFVPWRTLVLPARLWGDLPAATRESLLLHELAHLRRRDHWLRAIVGISCILGWWNPLVWLLRSVVRRNSEEAADAWVTERRPHWRETYANGLLEAQRHLLEQGSGSLRAALSALSPPARLLGRRIRLLFDEARPRTSWAGTLLLVAVSGAGSGASWLAVQVTAAPETRADASSRAPLGLRDVLGRLWIRLEGETRPELLSEYVSQLQNAREAQERRRAADDLGNLFEQATVAVPVLLQAMAADDSPSVRREAVDAIGRIGPQVADEAMPQLLRTLAEDPAPRVRREVEDVLERFRARQR